MTVEIDPTGRVVDVNQTETFICMQAAARQIKLHGDGGSITIQ